MSADSERDALIQPVDEALRSWRQGDCVLGEHWFAHRIDVSFALTAAGRASAEEGMDLAEQEVPGFVVVTQTCDIVRSCTERPYIELCPLVEVDADRLHEIQRCRRPAYAYVPLLSERRLVADLDRVMTIEKPLLAKWERVPGWSNDTEARAFALALSRKRARFAFPDDFSALVSNLQARLVKKHDKGSDEGRGLRSLVEIRVQAAPSWNENQIELFFWFIRKEDAPDFEGKDWASLLQLWLDFLPGTGRYTSVGGLVTTLEDMRAQDYVDSDPLDLDHLSTGSSSN